MTLEISVSPGAAEACGLVPVNFRSDLCADSLKSIMRLVDKRFVGIARGVGTANILGRVHSAQLKLADLFLPCSFTIMEVPQIPFHPLSCVAHITFGQGRDVELLLGLDMLKGHRACIDLEKNVLRIQGREVSFLSEHELPERARDSKELADLLEGSAGPTSSSLSSNLGPPISNQGPGNPTPVSFPGGGRALGSTPAGPSGGGNGTGSSSGHPESSIRTIMDLGVNREVAIRTLDAADGNVDVAASLLF